MNKESVDGPLGLYGPGIAEHGFTDDFFNELIPVTQFVQAPPEVIERYMDGYRCGNGKTYSQRYADKPEILEASDQTIVAKIDSMMEEMFEAARRNDVDRVIAITLEIRALRSNS